MYKSYTCKSPSSKSCVCICICLAPCILPEKGDPGFWASCYQGNQYSNWPFLHGTLKTLFLQAPLWGKTSTSARSAARMMQTAQWTALGVKFTSLEEKETRTLPGPFPQGRESMQLVENYMAKLSAWQLTKKDSASKHPLRSLVYLHFSLENHPTSGYPQEPTHPC